MWWRSSFENTCSGSHDASEIGYPLHLTKYWYPQWSGLGEMGQVQSQSHARTMQGESAREWCIGFYFYGLSRQGHVHDHLMVTWQSGGVHHSMCPLEQGNILVAYGLVAMKETNKWKRNRYHELNDGKNEVANDGKKSRKMINERKQNRHHRWNQPRACKAVLRSDKWGSWSQFNEVEKGKCEWCWGFWEWWLGHE